MLILVFYYGSFSKSSNYYCLGSYYVYNLKLGYKREQRVSFS